MTLERMLTDTATVLVHGEGADDRYGNAEDTWGGGVDYPARFHQSGGAEPNAGDRSPLIGDWSVFLPADAVVGGRDRVRDQHGRTFEVVGPPVIATTPRKGAHHVEARLRAIEG